mgnify:CR=1 FL=1
MKGSYFFAMKRIIEMTKVFSYLFFQVSLVKLTELALYEFLTQAFVLTIYGSAAISNRPFEARMVLLGLQNRGLSFWSLFQNIVVYFIRKKALNSIFCFVLGIRKYSQLEIWMIGKFGDLNVKEMVIHLNEWELLIVENYFCNVRCYTISTYAISKGDTKKTVTIDVLLKHYAWGEAYWKQTKHILFCPGLNNY